MRRGALCWIGFVLSFAASTIHAQRPLSTTARSGECGACTLEWSIGPSIDVRVLGVRPTEAASVATAADGTLYAGTLEGGLYAVRFLADGTRAESLELGKRFRRGDTGLPDAVSIAPDGSFHLVDEAIDRVPPGALHVDSHRRQGDLPRQVHSVTAFSRDTILIQGLLVSTAGAHLYHLYSHRRGFLRSFGDTDEGVAFVRSFAAARRRIARYGDSRFVSIRPNQYQLEIWTLDGELEETLRPSADWFAPWSQRDLLPDIRRARWPTMIQGVVLDSLDIAWVVGWRPKSSATASALPDLPDQNLTRRLLESRIESVVELLDLRCGGKFVLSSVIPHALQGFVGEGTSMISDFDVSRNEPAFRIVRFEADLSTYLRSRDRSCSSSTGR